MTVSSKTTESFGRAFKDNSDPARDGAFIRYLDKLFKGEFEKLMERVDSSPEGQEIFIQIAEDALIQAIYPDETLHLFSSTKDRYNRSMRRYIISEKGKNKYIVDVLGTLDTKMVLSKARRFYEKYISFRPWKLRLDRAVDPRIVYEMRLWYTPINYYDFVLKECTLNVPYSSDIEKIKSIIGVPHYYNQKDKNYERTDFDIRRALFNEISGVIEKGNGRKGILTTRGNDSSFVG